VDGDNTQKLDRILELAEENNAMLKKIRGAQKTAQMFRAIYWVLIIASFLGAFYFIKPYLESIVGLYSGLSGMKDKAGSFQLPDTKQIQDLINQLK
jgi:hypothetical protein